MKPSWPSPGPPGAASACHQGNPARGCALLPPPNSGQLPVPHFTEGLATSRSRSEAVRTCGNTPLIRHVRACVCTEEVHKGTAQTPLWGVPRGLTHLGGGLLPPCHLSPDSKAHRYLYLKVTNHSSSDPSSPFPAQLRAPGPLPPLSLVAPGILPLETFLACSPQSQAGEDP